MIDKKEIEDRKHKLNETITKLIFECKEEHTKLSGKDIIFSVPSEDGILEIKVSSFLGFTIYMHDMDYKFNVEKDTELHKYLTEVQNWLFKKVEQEELEKESKIINKLESEIKKADKVFLRKSKFKDLKEKELENGNKREPRGFFGRFRSKK